MGGWLTGPFGNAWLKDLVKDGRAMLIYDRGGYPFRYAVSMKDLLAQLPNEPAPHTGPTIIGEDYHMPKGWRGSFEVQREKLSACHPNEMIIIDTWDQS